MARLIGLVQRTSTVVTEPADLHAQLAAAHPVILAVWHGQFMMTVAMRPPDVDVAAMVARHGDAELIGAAMAAYGVDLIRGAGAGGRRKDRGGAQALRAAVGALTGTGGRTRASLVMTADVPPGPARRAGEGIIQIARLSGCPIVPAAAATRRFWSLRTWSRLTINLPFSKLALVAGSPIHVPRDADSEALERLRLEVERALDAVTARAYALAGADLDRATPASAMMAPSPPGGILKAYGVATAALKPLVGPLLRHRQKRGKEDGARLGERRGIASLTRPEGPVAWIHAASVGETNAVLPLITGLLEERPEFHVVLTTTTVTSGAIAAKRLPARAVHQYVPLDATDYANRFLDHWRPGIAIFTESEIWPGLILSTAARGIPLALVNARMSDKSHRSWQRLPGVAWPLFQRFAVIVAQNDRLAKRFRDCGGRRVIAAGNLKADAPPPPVDRVTLDELRGRLVARPRLLAASTHEGEEAILAAAHAELARSIPGFCTIIVPRHPERGAAIATELGALGLTVARRSLGQALSATVDVYIADTIGELGTFYAACPVAFIGGSLVPHGGQNPLEAIPYGSALLCGPSRHNFGDEYAALAAAGGVVGVATAAELANRVRELHDDPTRRAALEAGARAAHATLRGALSRTLEAIHPLLPPRAAAEPQAMLHAS